MRPSLWVESPFQLLSAAEAGYAGLIGAGEVWLREGVPALRATAEQVALPAGLAPVRYSDRPGPSDGLWAVGDPFSGQVQARLLRAMPEQLVLVDDGMATLHLLDLLGADRTRPLIRARTRPSGPRKALGAAVAARVRAAARQGRVTVFTAMPASSRSLAAARETGVRVVAHDFPWLRRLPPPGTPTQERLVLGTSLVANGLIDRDAYLSWVGSLAGRDEIAYLPHPREDARTLEAISADPRIVVDGRNLPAELALRDLRPAQHVISLPSTALVSLRLLHGPRRARIDAVPVPEHWWTRAADPDLRVQLGRAAA